MRARHVRLGVAVMLTPLALGAAAGVSLQWEALPSLPDEFGFAGPFSGTHREVLLVAGGANFPDNPPWEGGRKVWHDRVFVLEKPGGAWRLAGRLSRPVGYGVSLSAQEGVVCLGGSDAQRHYAEVFLLRWAEQSRIEISPLPPLPRPCANACGAILGSTVYLAGGIETPNATNVLRTFWSLDLGSPGQQWLELEPWPGPGRMLAVAAALGDAFYLASGVEVSADEQGKPVRRYWKDAYRYRPGRGWNRLADLPRAAAAAPSPAPVHGRTGFLILGGDDGTLVNFQPPSQHPGFEKTVLRYDASANGWELLGGIPAAPVTTVTVRWNQSWVVPTGEVRPGVRTPVVWSFR